MIRLILVLFIPFRTISKRTIEILWRWLDGYDLTVNAMINTIAKTQIPSQSSNDIVQQPL